jgi:hypothetical protein
MSVPYKNVKFNSTSMKVKFFKGKIVEIDGKIGIVLAIHRITLKR